MAAFRLTIDILAPLFQPAPASRRQGEVRHAAPDPVPCRLCLLEGAVPGSYRSVASPACACPVGFYPCGIFSTLRPTVRWTSCVHEPTTGTGHRVKGGLRGTFAHYAHFAPGGRIASIIDAGTSLSSVPRGTLPLSAGVLRTELHPRRSASRPSGRRKNYEAGGGATPPASACSRRSSRTLCGTTKPGRLVALTR